MSDAASRERARRIAALGHDLRTPLNAIIGFAEILSRGLAPDAARQQEFAEEILKGAKQLLGTIDRLVEQVRAETDEPPPPAGGA